MSSRLLPALQAGTPVTFANPVIAVAVAILIHSAAAVMADQSAAYLLEARLDVPFDELIAFDMNGSVSQRWNLGGQLGGRGLHTDGRWPIAVVGRHGALINDPSIPQRLRRIPLDGDLGEPITELNIWGTVNQDSYGQYYGSFQGNSLARLDPEGNLTLAIPYGPPNYLSLRSLAAAADGRIFGISNERLYQWTAAGISIGTYPLPFEYAADIAVDEVRQLLYLAAEPGRITVYDIATTTPQFVRQFPTPTLSILFELYVDQFHGHVFAAGFGGGVEMDTHGNVLGTYFAPVGYGILPASAFALDADLDGNRSLESDDLDALVAAIATGSTAPQFDMTGDSRVDIDDIRAWLADAGIVNLPGGVSYAMGDANLDGHVDAADFDQWNTHKFTVGAAWSHGDFNADGVVDGSDFGIWNSSKSTVFQGTVVVPEPRFVLQWPLVLALLFVWRPAFSVRAPHRHSAES